MPIHSLRGSECPQDNRMLPISNIYCTPLSRVCLFVCFFSSFFFLSLLFLFQSLAQGKLARSCSVYPGPNSGWHNALLLDLPEATPQNQIEFLKNAHAQIPPLKILNESTMGPGHLTFWNSSNNCNVFCAVENQLVVVGTWQCHKDRELL